MQNNRAPEFTKPEPETFEDIPKSFPMGIPFDIVYTNAKVS